MAGKSRCKTVRIKGRGRRCMCPDSKGHMRFAKNARCKIRVAGK